MFVGNLVRSFPRRLWFTLLLLSSTWNLVANSYFIDTSCSNYKGRNIGDDIQQAIEEVQAMATNALIRVQQSEQTSSPITVVRNLFGTNNEHLYYVKTINSTFTAYPVADGDFGVMCNDLMVTLEDDFIKDVPDPRGIWVDYDHGWELGFDKFRLCDATRKLGASYRSTIRSFTIKDNWIYLCPVLLDNRHGLTLAPYKDQVLIDEVLDSYLLVAVCLLHELLHIRNTIPVWDTLVKDFPPVNEIDRVLLGMAITNPTRFGAINAWVPAFGSTMCFKLALDMPHRAQGNAFSLAFCALGLYLHRTDWVYGAGKPIPLERNQSVSIRTDAHTMKGVGGGDENPL